MHHLFFIHSSTDGHLGCFHFLAIVNNSRVIKLLNFLVTGDFLDILLKEQNSSRLKEPKNRVTVTKRKGTVEVGGNGGIRGKGGITISTHNVPGEHEKGSKHREDK